MVLTGVDQTRMKESVICLKSILKIPMDKARDILERVAAAADVDDGKGRSSEDEEEDLRLQLSQEKAELTIKSLAEEGLVAISRKVQQQSRETEKK